jgi:hypothetical protein
VGSEIDQRFARDGARRSMKGDAMSGRPSRPRPLAPWLLISMFAAQAAVAAGTGTVSGKYIGNGKAAALAFARVIPHDKWQDETAYTLILSEKDASEADKPDFDAMFGELGHALVINITQKGSIFGTQVCHQALEKSGFSSIGPIKVERFSTEGGKLSAHLFTEGEQEFSGDKWSVDLEVKGVPLPK